MMLFDSLKTLELQEKDPLLFEGFVNFIAKYKSPYNEVSKLKGIPNTPESLAMVDLYRKLVLRTSGYELLSGKLQKLPVNFTVRLKGRGANRKQLAAQAYVDHGQRTTFAAHISHAYATTFALYHHLDYQYED